MNDLISIIIPIYNAGERLRNCIQSVLDQTYKNFELILVDDGSTDVSPAICDDFSKQDSRIKVIHKINGGLVNARKTGIIAAKGDFIAYVDHDDIIEAEMYEVLMDAEKNTNADIVISGYKEDLDKNSSEILKNTIPSGVYTGDSLVQNVYSKMIFNEKFSNFGISTYLWNKLFKKEVIYDIQLNVFEKISLGEDACVTYPAILNAKSVCIIDSCLYHYVQHTDSMMKSRTNLQKDWQKLSYLYDYLKASVNKSRYKSLVLPQIEKYILSLATVFISGINKGAFPFAELGTNIVICGAGTFGQHLYKRFIENDDYNIVKWVDQNYIKYRRVNLPVNSIDSLINSDFDSVIIAYISESNAVAMKKVLMNFGVNENKIVWLNYDFKNPVEMLKEFNL
ncbi:MAG: glycosyltransferase [Candidatus Gastranaerophilales bacterium]|nr:glycosyltransferase [Candidatus Gastranaerophilales bacterium]